MGAKRLGRKIAGVRSGRACGQGRRAEKQEVRFR